MTDPLETLRTEQVEAVELLRATFPGISDAAAENAAMALRGCIYRIGRWPTVNEILDLDDFETVRRLLQKDVPASHSPLVAAE